METLSTTPTTKQTIEDVKERFIYLSAKRSYRRAWSQLQNEFDHDLIAAFATQTRTPNPEGQRKANPDHLRAARTWSHLHRNTETRP